MFNHHVKEITRNTLVKVQNEYAQLLNTTSFSLQDLFNYGDFKLEDYCQTFHPHPQLEKLTKVAQRFGEHYGIWLDSARYYISCALFVYPTADFDKAIAMVKNCAVDYYLNDTMGREIFSQLTPAQQAEASEIIERMGEVDEHLNIMLNYHPVELANREMLAYIRDTSPTEWFRDFVKLYSYHIAVTHKDNNAAALQRIPSVDEYIEMRNHTSGMPHIVLLIEYSEGAFLDWDQIDKMGIADTLRAVHRATALFGCLTNDLFSFEKEVIKNNTDANLVMAIALNYPEYSLPEVILHAAEIVRENLKGLMSNMEEIRQRCKIFTAEEVETVAILNKHMMGLEKCVQASWMWQVYTRRYKNSLSIWDETQLAATKVAATV